jgi:hypothetical protein
MDHPRFLLYMWASQQGQYVPTLGSRALNQGSAYDREMRNMHPTVREDKENTTPCIINTLSQTCAGCLGTEEEHETVL